MIQYLKLFSLLILMLCINCISPLINAANQDNKLNLEYIDETEINEQFSGMKVIAEDLRVSKKEVLNFNSDGSVTSKIGEKERKGLWYTDSRGKHCIRWDDKDKSNCADIMRDENGNWVKVKDDIIIKRYESFEKLNQRAKDKNK